MPSINGNTANLNKEVFTALKKINTADGINKQEALELKKAIMADGKVDLAEKDLLGEILSSSVTLKFSCEDPKFSPIDLKFGTKKVTDDAKAVIVSLLEDNDTSFKDASISGGKSALMGGGSIAAVKVTAKVVSGASRFAMAVPVVGVVTGGAITAYDTYDAVQKSKDPNVSSASAALAWTTVGLDAVATGCAAVTPGAAATVVGVPVAVVSEVVGIVATGLAVGTSFLSDYLK